jgi:serine/threonine protein kinase
VGPVYHRSRFADVSKGEYSGSPVAVKRLRANEGDYNRVFKVPSIIGSIHTDSSPYAQNLCREVIGWRHLIHPNILPLLGVAMAPDSNYFDILTDWMPNGDIVRFARSNLEANRLQLVGTLADFLRSFAC